LRVGIVISTEKMTRIKELQQRRLIAVRQGVIT